MQAIQPASKPKIPASPSMKTQAAPVANKAVVGQDKQVDVQEQLEPANKIEKKERGRAQVFELNLVPQ
jgi:hypothetical protein